jgi:tRNA nucleotidyltransferase (CCA-adding enzyme)
MRKELESLTKERVYKEVEKILKMKNSRVFFETLLELNVLDVLFPSVYDLLTCREGTKHHRESTVFEHTMCCLDEIDRVNPTDVVSVKLALLYHDIAKPSRIKAVGSSADHDNIARVEFMIDMWIPSGKNDIVLMFIEQHIRAWRLPEMTPQKILKFYKRFQGNVKVLEDFVIMANADSLGRICDTHKGLLDITFMSSVLKELNAYTPKHWIVSLEERPSGQRIRDYVHKQELEIVKRRYKELKNGGNT